MTDPIEVSAALLFREGKLLITERPAGAHLAGLWEFPGGKREPGETWESCLQRELREELAVEIEVGALFDEVTCTYPERTVHIRFYLARLRSGDPRAVGCASFQWVTPEQLASRALPEADLVVKRRLLQDSAIWNS